MDPADAEPTPALPEDPLANVPELHTYLTADPAERTAALKLVADSIAQMRQTANNSLIFHPLNLALFVGVLAVIIRYMINAGHEPFIVGTTCTGLLCIELVLIRFLTQDYLLAAEEINWAWLGDADMIVTKFGDEVIGTVVVEWVSGEARGKRKKAWKGEIKAWTVRLRYRRKGVGRALLEEAVKESRKKGAEGIEFQEGHANSKRVLPVFYSGKFDKGDRKAREKLQDLLGSSPTKTRRKRGSSG
ncbi:uncharacterized protein LTR77_009292 [Saxophila tyrrhenica]|uniref:N-acetyltransferase domain-containing protein n=1 Tax=Saxophila tyrrhenica TaxID=1690608 RepID=A0AAV9NYN6_9PEZI|nr:hypothetical protein LTR77_009292 [Saxophila tyrrhenica]